MVVATTENDESKLNFNLGNLEQKKIKMTKNKRKRTTMPRLNNLMKNQEENQSSRKSGCTEVCTDGCLSQSRLLILVQGDKFKQIGFKIAPPPLSLKRRRVI